LLVFYTVFNPIGIQFDTEDVDKNVISGSEFRENRRREKEI